MTFYQIFKMASSGLKENVAPHNTVNINSLNNIHLNQQQTNIHYNICQHTKRVLVYLRTHNSTSLTIRGKILLRTTFLTTILLGTFSFRPEEAILKIWQILVLIQIKFLFSEKNTTDMITNRMRNIHTSCRFYFTFLLYAIRVDFTELVSYGIPILLH